MKSHHSQFFLIICLILYIGTLIIIKIRTVDTITHHELSIVDLSSGFANFPVFIIILEKTTNPFLTSTLSHKPYNFNY